MLGPEFLIADKEWNMDPNPGTPPVGVDPSRTALLLQRFPILEFFRYEHLPERLQADSRRFSELAWDIADGALVGGIVRRPAELAAGLRKLLEAKDCVVRSALP